MRKCFMFNLLEICISGANLDQLQLIQAIFGAVDPPPPLSHVWRDRTSWDGRTELGNRKGRV